MDDGTYLTNLQEAYKFKGHIISPRARGALQAAHLGILECFVTPLHYLKERLRPAVPTDVLFFFQAISDTFATWDEAASHREEATITNSAIINIHKASDYINTITSRRAKSILRNLLHVIASRPYSPNSFLDVEFCCKLLGAYIVHDDVLDSILTGTAAKKMDENNADPIDWF